MCLTAPFKLFPCSWSTGLHMAFLDSQFNKASLSQIKVSQTVYNFNFFPGKTACYFCSIFWFLVLCHRVICLYWNEACVNSTKLQADVFFSFLNDIKKGHTSQLFLQERNIYRPVTFAYRLQFFKQAFDIIRCPRKASWNFFERV